MDKLNVTWKCPACKNENAMKESACKVCGIEKRVWEETVRIPYREKMKTPLEMHRHAEMEEMRLFSLRERLSLVLNQKVSESIPPVGEIKIPVPGTWKGWLAFAAMLLAIAAVVWALG